jgi:hypothetical protein
VIISKCFNFQNFAHGPLAVDNNVANTNVNSNESNANEVRKLQDDNNQLVKKNNGKNALVVN